MSQSFWTSLWLGLCSFAAVLFGWSNDRTHGAKADHRGPTDPKNALQKPPAYPLRLWRSQTSNRDFPFAQYPMIETFPKAVERTPSLVRCGNVAYKTIWTLSDTENPRVNFEAPESLTHNRALFIAHTKKVLTRGGMQASRPQLYAAADLYKANIRVWSRDARRDGPWALYETVKPQQETTDKTIDVCLYMQNGDASHYRVLQDVTAVEAEPGVTHATTARVIEAGAEGECLYLALAWALDRGEARVLRATYDALRQENKAPKSYVAYVKSQSSMLTEMHHEVACALLQPEHAARIDAEVQDAIEMQLRQRDRRFRLR